MLLPSLIFVTIYLGFSFGYKVFIQGTCGLKPIVTDIEVYFKEMVWFFYREQQQWKGTSL